MRTIGLIMATKKQIQIIHIAKEQLGIDEETYREILGRFRVKSSKDLNNEQAKGLIHYFQEAGFRIKVKYREDMITPKQIAYLKYLWRSHPNVRNKKIEALESYVSRILKIDRLEWIPRDRVSKIIKAIQNIK